MMLDILFELNAAARQAPSLRDIAQYIVRGGQHLGFERVRLWRTTKDQIEIVGLAQIGNIGLDQFEGFRTVISESRHLTHALASRHPILCNSTNTDAFVLVRRFGSVGYQAPQGNFVALPLWDNADCLGILMLDTFTKPDAISPTVLRDLALFGQNVASIMKHVNWIEHSRSGSIYDRRWSLEQEVLIDIDNLATAYVASGELHDLLHRMHKCINKLVDARNFLVGVLDRQDGWLDFVLRIEEGKLQPRFWHQIDDSGLTAHLVEINRPLVLPEGGRDYREQWGIPLFGKQSKSWVGVPLSVADTVIGMLVVQSYEQANCYTRSDANILAEIARRIAGAVQATTQRERSDANRKRLTTLLKAGQNLPILAEQSLDWLWRVALNVATADYGLGFNRAMLFLTEQRATVLRGNLGVGNIEEHAAREDWENDVERGHTFEQYLEELRTGHYHRGTVDLAMDAFRQPLGDAFQELLNAVSTGRPDPIDASAMPGILPAEFVATFGKTMYAPVPIRSSERLLGVLIVDNKHNHEPLRNSRLDQLENWLAQVVLVHDQYRQRRLQEQLTDITRNVLALVSPETLKESIQQVCDLAQESTEADCVVIYSLDPDSASEQLKYDVKHAVAAGLHHDFQPVDGPGSSQISHDVLRKGRLERVDDVQATTWYEADTRIPHSFLIREKIRAFIAAPVFDIESQEVRGVLYLDYRSVGVPDYDVKWAEYFAQLVGAALQVVRASTAAQNEAILMRRVLETGRNPAAYEKAEKALILNVLEAAQKLLGQDSVRIGLLLRDWESSQDGKEPREVRHQHFLVEGRPEYSREDDLQRGITGQAFATGESQHADDIRQPPWNELFYGDHSPNTRSELDVVLQIEPPPNPVLGVINVESPEKEAFSIRDRLKLERLATTATVAFENFRRQQKLQEIKSLAARISTARDAYAALEDVVETARRVAPGVSAITTWYRPLEQNGLCPGPQFGVRNPQRMIPDETIATSNIVLTQILREEEPIWANDVSQDLRLNEHFIVEEGIKSVAAIPLIVRETNSQAVGILFFNYRHNHVFTKEERAIFPLVAAIAGASIREMLQLQELKKKTLELEREKELREAANRIFETVGSRFLLEETVGAILQAVSNLFESTSCAILTYNKQRHFLAFASPSENYYPKEKLGKFVELPVGKNKGGSVASQVAQEALDRGDLVVRNVTDGREDPYYLVGDEELRSQLCVSLMGTNKDLLGVLVLESKQVARFNDLDVDRVQRISQSISFVLERVNRERAYRQQRAVSAATTWAAEIAHDLIGEVRQIQHSVVQLKAHLPKTFQADLQKINLSANRLSSYIMTPKAQKPEEIELDAWIRAYVNDYIEEKDEQVRIESDYNCGGARVKVMRVLLGRVLKHLIRNAVEAMKNQGIRIIRIKTRQTDDFIEVFVGNSGPPIPLDVHQKLFDEPFTTKKEEPGHGQGLLFIQDALAQMGGGIALWSKPEQETEFRFTLPINPVIDVIEDGQA